MCGRSRHQDTKPILRAPSGPGRSPRRRRITCDLSKQGRWGFSESDLDEMCSGNRSRKATFSQREKPMFSQRENPIFGQGENPFSVNEMRSGTREKRADGNAPGKPEGRQPRTKTARVCLHFGPAAEASDIQRNNRQISFGQGLPMTGVRVWFQAGDLPRPKAAIRVIAHHDATFGCGRWSTIKLG